MWPRLATSLTVPRTWHGKATGKAMGKATAFLFPISGVVFLPPFSGGQLLVLLLFRSSNPSESLLSIDLIDFSAFRFRSAYVVMR